MFAEPLNGRKDDKPAAWCHQGALTRYEWNQSRDELDRIMRACRS